MIHTVISLAGGVVMCHRFFYDKTMHLYRPTAYITEHGRWYLFWCYHL